MGETYNQEGMTGANGERGMDFGIDALTIVARLCVAALLGGFVGWERERRNKQAGFKTHLLVSVGSALVMLTSIYGFGDYNNPEARYDPARLAAQVVSGIGFLGAGAILRRSNLVVSGLTTAATLWVVAGIGLSVGAGFYLPAVVTTGIVFVSVVLLRGVEERYASPMQDVTLQMKIWDQPGILHRLSTALEGEVAEIRSVSVTESREENGHPYLTVRLRVRLPARKKLLDFAGRLGEIEGVQEVHSLD
ncbi:MgtC/SapB family protein [Brevibacillus sp. B_LB10_24]|uniref:MgtC/SapB family protein n=1 Tax=Brevibacillus sp. B_LB10_24 TaxID=3380645 RepID=UPI0038B97F48